MNELRVVRAGRTGKVTPLYERDSKSAKAGVTGNARARCATAYNEQVEGFVRQTGEVSAHEIPNRATRNLVAAAGIVNCWVERMPQS